MGPNYGVANVTAIDFETLSDETIVGNAYLGVIYSNAIELPAVVSLTVYEFSPFSGQNAAFDIAFSLTAQQFLSAMLPHNG